MSRVCLTACVLAVALAAVLLAGLTLGDYPMTPLQALRALVGQGDPAALMVVREWRLPRVVMAPLAGAALGLSGAICQSLTRNPLGSPDIIGFDAGAHAGAMLVLLAGGGFAALAGGAIGGGMVAALAVYLLAWRGGSDGFRLILVGIGVGQLLFALSQWLMLRADPETAIAVAVWASGSLNGIEADRVWPAILTLPPVMGLGLALVPALRQLELGDDLAQASGLGVERARPLLILVGVALTAIVTAISGPIAFVALVAPQLARHLAQAGGVAPWLSALAGAVLLAGADLFAAHGMGEIRLPVGIVTLCLGGGWFVWLLARRMRESA